MPIIEGSSLKNYKYRDNVFSFEGCVSVQETSDWISPWRIEYDRADFYPFLSQIGSYKWSAPVGAQCSGVRICFSTDADTVMLELQNVIEGLKLDLYVNNCFSEELVMDGHTNTATFKDLNSNFKKIEIWLDQRHAFYLRNIWINKDAKICKTRITQRRWIHYGSSISHSREASTPSGIWTSIVARKLDLYLTNLGFAANCVIEPMIGRLIRDLPADFITLKLGINVHRRLTRRNFATNVIGFVQTIREKHTDTPLAIISPILSPSREKMKVIEDGLSLEEMRENLYNVVESCKKYGDRNIYYVDGLRIFGQDELKYLPDGLHPNAEGQEVFADKFIKEVFESFPA
ncbi:MAG TPA: hypothetical protein DD426_00110 [Clostridiaceae bacterium]|nr:hypothetical protein [Clostridiaceae bacterium]